MILRFFAQHCASLYFFLIMELSRYVLLLTMYDMLIFSIILFDRIYHISGYTVTGVEEKVVEKVPKGRLWSLRV